MGCDSAPTLASCAKEPAIQNTSARAAQIRSRIEKTYREGVVLGEDGVSYSINPISVTAERGAFIRELCRAEGPRATLEIGMAWGLSTLFILEAHAAGAIPFSHIVVDPFQTAWFHGAGRRPVRDLGMEQEVQVIEEFSRIALARMAAEARCFDLIFIDGGHRFEDVFVDMVFCDLLLKPGGAMIFDDSWSDPVFLTCRFAETNFGYLPIANFPEHSQKKARRRRRERLGERPRMRALRKPTETSARDVFDFNPFFGDFTPDHAAEHRRLVEDGITRLRLGQGSAARRSFFQAARLDPWRLKTWSRLLRTFLPNALALRLSASPDGQKEKPGAEPSA